MPGIPNPSFPSYSSTQFKSVDNSELTCSIRWRLRGGWWCSLPGTPIPWPSPRTDGSSPGAPSGESQLRGPHRGLECLRLGHLQVSHNTVALTEDGRVFAWGTFRWVPQAKPTVFRISGYFIYIKIRLEKNTYLPSPLNHVLFSIIYIYRYIVAFSRRIPFLTSVWKPYLQILVGCPAFL